MRVITLFSFLILTCICAFGQNLVGYNDKEIKKYMKENHTEMNLDHVNNNKFKYLKYSDNSESQTLIFFLNSDSVCRSVRMICDIRIKPAKVKEFNSIYKKSDENRWIDKHDGKDYLVEIRDEKWTCIITIEPDK